ncbi:MAG: ATP-binding cassette domain-containing protein [Prevotellaceae bacterium]|nr:ATP-binding cassette domain-containing protein [Prevotellaceae bacterium]
MREKLYYIRNGVVHDSRAAFGQLPQVEIVRGMHVAVTGPNASGKTLLLEVLAGRRKIETQAESLFPAATAVAFVSFRDAYGRHAPRYYQQRWNKGDEELLPLVREQYETLTQNVLAGTLAADLLDKTVTMLSSGELRRLQMARALASGPKVLIVDNPFIGLDCVARRKFAGLLERLSQEMTIILSAAREEEIPLFVTHVIRMTNGVAGPCTAFCPAEKLRCETENPLCLDKTDFSPSEEIVRLDNVSVSYDGRDILRRIDWTVRRGERWALIGENGAGKSTLLSLVCADNPQAYALSVSLFGCRRGTGESIWDIKRRIGYASSELAYTYQRPIAVADVVADGFFDTVGAFRRPTAAQREVALSWLCAFGLHGADSRDFRTLSLGEQRLALLARAFVKEPELLVLDEPFQGLDRHNMEQARAVVERYMEDKSKTLVMVTHCDEELPPCINRILKLEKPL